MKQYFLLVGTLITLLMVNAVAQTPPPFPYTIGGTLTVDGVKLTQVTAGSNYRIVVRKVDNTDFTTIAGAKAETKALNPFDSYTIQIPIFDATSQPGGATPGQTAIIKVFFKDSELTVNSPVNSQFTVGSSDGDATINLVVATPCAYNATVSASSFGAAGGNGTASITSTPSLCAWNATTDANWISLTAPVSGSGNGSVNFVIAANPTISLREGNISIGGKTFKITQAGITCSYQLSAPSQSLTASGGNGSFNVIAPGGCAWTATPSDNWITISSGSGNGTGAVNFTVAANNVASSRSGTISVQGQIFNITQAAASCTFTLSPTNQSVNASGVTGNFSVTSPNGCAWTATTGDSWIIIASGSSSGNGTGTVNFSVAANTAPARSGTITVAGQTFTINQSSGCTYSISPTSKSFAASGGQGSTSVTTAGACPWTAVSNNDWITISSGSNGTGNGAVNFSVTANTVAISRTGTITIAGQTFTVTQEAACVTTAITTPPSGQTRIIGQAVTFSVVAQGENLTYQWRKNGEAINNAKASSYTIPATVLSDAGNYDVVITGTCGTVTSNVATLTVNNPAPTITVLNPGNTSAGVSTFTLSVTGTGFVSGIVVRWNGQARETKFVSSTLVTATIPASDIVNAGSIQITVVNPSPGGGESNTLAFSIFSGYEADLSPRPYGKRDGKVTISDWIQAGRFIVGLDTPQFGSEFQRADSAPKATLGDGKITLSDWVQAGRYSIGLDAVVAAGGPTSPVFGAVLGNVLSTDFRRVEARTSPEGDTLNAERTVRAINTNFTRGQVGTVQIALDAQGNENAVSFSLQFDPKVMSFVEATAGDGANGAAVIVNSSQAANGRLGLAIMLPAGQQFAAGTQTLLNLRFIPNGGDSAVSTSVSFSDQMLAREVVDSLATPIAQVSFVGSTVNISGKAVATVSAANYVGGEQAAESIVSAFGLQLSSFTQAAPSLPLPISLGGSQVVVRDSKGTERFAPLFYASPGQLNFQIPAGTAEGVATLTIFSGGGTSQTGLVMIGRVAPALFSADSTGAGFAAGSALTVNADGSRTENNLASYDGTKFVAQPIDVSGSGKQVYLTLYGTGIKNRNDLANVKIKIGGIDTQVEYAGAQGFFAGLDQLNVRMPPGLSGRGTVNIEMNIEGKTGNITTISIK